MVLGIVLFGLAIVLMLGRTVSEEISTSQNDEV